MATKQTRSKTSQKGILSLLQIIYRTVEVARVESFTAIGR